MIYLCIYLAIGLLVLLGPYRQRILSLDSRCVLFGAVVSVLLLWPVLIGIDALDMLQRGREERQLQREWDDPTLVSGEPTDDEPTLPCAPPEPADWDNVIELRGRR